MAKALRTPYRTYQDWEAGKARIPGVASVAVELIQERDRWVTQTVIEKVAAGIERDYPGGIPSEPDADGENSLDPC